jgi:hypothetical protein
VSFTHDLADHPAGKAQARLWLRRTSCHPTELGCCPHAQPIHMERGNEEIGQESIPLGSPPKGEADTTLGDQNASRLFEGTLASLPDPIETGDNIETLIRGGQCEHIPRLEAPTRSPRRSNPDQFISWNRIGLRQVRPLRGPRSPSLSCSLPVHGVSSAIEAGAPQTTRMDTGRLTDLPIPRGPRCPLSPGPGRAECSAETACGANLDKRGTIGDMRLFNSP